MPLSTVQSRKVILTKDERDYFVKITDEDLRKCNEELARERASIKNNTKHSQNGFSDVDYYGDMKSKHHTYNDPIASTPYMVGVRLLADLVSRYVTDKDAKLLDAGAGSGYLGIEVKKLGFLNIDCLEPSKGMIDMQPKDLYGNVYEEVISYSKPSTVVTGHYDCVMLCGAVLSSLIEVEDFPELLRIVKPCGHVIFNISDYWYGYNDYGLRLDTMLQTCLESGTLEYVVKERRAYIYPVEDATVYVLQKAS